MTVANEDGLPPKVSTLTRTLLIAGYEVTGAKRRPRQIEISCTRKDFFGATIPYLISLTDEDQPPPDELGSLQDLASATKQILVFIASRPGPNWIAWDDALEALGGAVPSWRALTPDYRGLLLQLGSNQLPPGYSGEAWRLFEVAAADGFEFIFGTRVRRLGGAKRGQRVSDMLARADNETLLVIDAKASEGPFSVSMADLRPLSEYVATQITRQRGQVNVGAAVLIANDFAQDEARIQNVAGEFIAENRIPLVCLTSTVLVEMVETLSRNPTLRTAIIWKRIFCKPGLVKLDALPKEAQLALEERVTRA